MGVKNIHTRFRAYQLVTKGSSFSYWDSNTNRFCLGEARYNNDNIASIIHELRRCDKSKIDDLYISSWDSDHCVASELEIILTELRPSSIYYPRYKPDLKKQNQIDSKKLIDNYNGPPTPIKSNGTGFQEAVPWTYNIVFYEQTLTDYPNDNSLICLWRCGNFSVLSVGDLESLSLSEDLARNNILPETDILILSHHGSSRDFTTEAFLKAINPRVCLALVDRNNQYRHPDNTVYQRVNKHSWYYSTKDGDIIIESHGNSNEKFTVYNYITGGNKLESVKTFTCKKVLK